MIELLALHKSCDARAGKLQALLRFLNLRFPAFDRRFGHFELRVTGLAAALRTKLAASRGSD